MPGVFGGCQIADGAPVSHSELAVMARPLQVDGSYRALVPAIGSSASIAAMDPQIRFGLAAFRDFPDQRFAIALYGELYTVPNRAAERDALSYLADWYSLDVGSAATRAATLDGSFVCAIQDYGRRELLLINDHAATRPLYYTVINNTLYFAPELRGLSCIGGFNREISLGCVVSFLANGIWMNDATLYAAVKSLPQATALHVRRGELAIRRFWTYDFDESAPDQGLTAYTEQLAPLLRAAVAKRLATIPDKGAMIVPISGGYDSRGILACIREMYDGPLKTVTWGTDEEDPSADGYIGRRVAAWFGTDHHFMQRTGSGKLEYDVAEMVFRLEASNDDPINHHSELTTMRRIRRLGVTDLFRGEKTYGYHGPAQSDAEALGSIGVIQAKDIGHVLSLMSPELKRSAHDAYDAHVKVFQESTTLRDPSNRKDYYYFASLLLHLLNRSSYYKFCVLDVKFPWLDIDIYNFYKQVPAVYRMDKRLYIDTIEHMFPQLNTIPYATRHSLEDWAHEVRTNQALKAFLGSVLLRPSNSFDELIEPAKLRRFVESCLTEPSVLPSGASTLRASKELLRGISPALYRRLKKHLMHRIPVPLNSPIPLLFRIAILKLWFDEREPPQATV